ncbi:MAG: MFS transporter [Deltaproteobacteria bacterium]
MGKSAGDKNASSDGAVPGRKPLIAACAANVLEWYDFALYGYFAPVLSRLFFPAEDEATSLISTFGVFAAGYFMRPLGALIFGHLGDKFGRRRALMASVALMAIPTALIGFLPTYAQIGIAAPILLTLCRLVQGISVGGEFTGSISFIVEHAPKSRRGFFGSFTTFSLIGGMLLGSGMGGLINSIYSEQEVLDWAWRMPFVLGVLVGFVGLYMRTGIEESPAFKALKESGDVSRAPVREALTNYWREILIIIGTSWVGSATFYMFFVYMATFLTRETGITMSAALNINTVSMAVMVAAAPVAGAISDRIGRKPPMIAGSLVIAVLSYPLFALMLKGNVLYDLAAQIIFALALAAVFAPYPAALVELFPSRVRMSAMSIGYNVGFAFLGGTTPLFAAYLIKETGNKAAPCVYIILSAVVSLLVFIKLRETHRDSIG